MVPPRVIDYQALRSLVHAHPDWSYNALADALTEQARSKDPSAPRVNPGSVGAAISRYREQWAEEGYEIGEAKTIYSDLIWWATAPDHKMDRIMRFLRAIVRMRLGLYVGDQWLVRNAPDFEHNLRKLKEVVDVSPEGRPYVRPARADELNEQGELIEITARKPEGYTRLKAIERWQRSGASSGR